MYHLTVLKKDGLSIMLTQRKGMAGPDKQHAEKFAHYFLTLCTRVDGLLGGDNFLIDHKDVVLSKRLFRLITLWNQRKTQELNVECAAVKLFLDDLEEINERDRNAFGSFKKKLIPERKSQSWPGLRFEVHVAASLYKKGCNIRKQERPDFLIMHNGSEVFVEAGSCRFDKPSAYSHFIKVRNTIYEKSTKTYANGKVALFLEVSNVFFNECKAAAPIDLEEFYADLVSDRKIKYGSIVLFSCIINNADKIYGSYYRRVDIDNCDLDLMSFLDSIYPNKEFIQMPELYDYAHTA